MISENKFYILGFDIGGTKIAVCLADEKGRIIDSRRVGGGTQTDYQYTFEEITALGDKMLEQAPGGRDQLRAIGVSSPGPLDMVNGVLLKSPNMVWRDVPLREDLSRHYQVPAILQNDASAGMLAEWFFGAARGCAEAIYLTMSTGIGGGVITGNSLLQGVSGVGAELGHVVLDLNGPLCGCGQRGCFEAFCGGRNVSRRMQEKLADDPDHPILQMDEVKGDFKKLNYQVLRAAYQEGIPWAREMWEETCLRTAQALGGLMMTFNPQLIILGTLAYYSGDMFMEPVRRYLDKFAWLQMRQKCSLTVPALGAQIGELAAVAPAYYSFHQAGEWQPPELDQDTRCSRNE